MNDSPTTAIAVSVLRKTYGSYAAVEDVSFDVPHGRVVGLLGPNGAGKTTTMRMLLGLARPDAGTALLDGTPYRELAQPARTVGAMLDDGGLHPGRTARQHLTISAAMAGVDAARVPAMLTETGLGAAADRRIGGYSLGMRQRLALAAALLGEPGILVLDEPANGLDPAGMRWLRQRLRAFADAGGAVLLSSHVLAEVSNVADDIIVVAQGRIVADGPIPELTARYGGDLESYYLDLTAETAEVR
ncbi:ABC transporter ATP-binding protein [Diaminobutyricimonas aerilata]|nr:ATP-binding cassette domain-containing protein [Diaminobutyricimonas aerilata]